MRENGALHKMSRFIYYLSTFLSILFLAAPLLAVFPLAFNSSSFLTYPLEGLTLKWFQLVFTEKWWTSAFINSIKVAVGVVCISLVVGGLSALGVALVGRTLKYILYGLFVSPLVMPSIIMGVALAYAFGRIGLGGSYWALVFAHSLLGIPLVFLSVITALKGLDPDLDDAAASLGASRMHRFWNIIFPLTIPGFLAGGLFAFIISFDEVVIALFLVAPDSTTLPIALFSSLRDKLQPTIVAVAFLLSILSFIFILVFGWAQKHAKGRH